MPFGLEGGEPGKLEPPPPGKEKPERDYEEFEIEE